MLAIAGNWKCCRVCMEHKPNDQFYLGHARCKACVKAAVAQWKRDNPSKAKAHAKAWAVKNKDKMREASKRYRATELGVSTVRKYRKTDRYAATRRSVFKRAVDVLADRYVRGMMARRSMLKPNDIPASLVDAKRFQLMIERECREKR